MCADTLAEFRGYFLYDTLGSILLPSEKGPTEKALNYFHHIISVICVSISP